MKKEAVDIDNKILVKLIVPEIAKEYQVYLPINKKMGNIINLLNTAVNDLSKGEFPKSETNSLYNSDTQKKYDANVILYQTDIRNGTRLVLIT